MSDEVKEECGVLGIYNGENLTRNITMGLYALQHRGQESAGFAIANGERVRVRKSMGLVSHLAREHNFDELLGHAVIGHVRYSTTGSSTLANAQPILVSCKWGHLAIVHNGNLTNTPQLRDEMEKDGHIFSSTTDSEVLLHEIARTKAENLSAAIKKACAKLTGSFCIIFLTKDDMYVVRDGYGFRPMSLGKMGKSWVVASETCAFDLLGADYVRDILPGEFLIIDRTGLRSEQFTTKPRKAHCIFEYVYFARPDSFIFNHSCDKIRRRIGRQLAKECPVSADIVIAVPDSSTTAALGYAQESKIPFEIGLLRNHYVGRTFIDPAQNVREQKVRLKFNTINGVLKGKRVCVVEDSIVRGTTLKLIAKMIRQAGATEVHVRISSPPVAHPCFFGMDFPTSGELVASSLTPEEIGKMLAVDSLGYLSVDGLRSAAPGGASDYCAACFDGVYPDQVPESACKTGCSVSP
ncbi:MAG TPA: amidophosphoribosyltransferase [Fibrobacteraceae bacterium]|nr:amidophosphoribosyltransferase [Fibrobacteraceae bacterium]